LGAGVNGSRGTGDVNGSRDTVAAGTGGVPTSSAGAESKSKSPGPPSSSGPMDDHHNNNNNNENQPRHVNNATYTALLDDAYLGVSDGGSVSLPIDGPSNEGKNKNKNVNVLKTSSRPRTNTGNLIVFNCI